MAKTTTTRMGGCCFVSIAFLMVCGYVVWGCGPLRVPRAKRVCVYRYVFEPRVGCRQGNLNVDRSWLTRDGEEESSTLISLFIYAIGYHLIRRLNGMDGNVSGDQRRGKDNSTAMVPFGQEIEGEVMCFLSFSTLCFVIVCFLLWSSPPLFLWCAIVEGVNRLRLNLSWASLFL